LVYGYQVCRTNPMINRDLNGIDYWYGSLMDTNNGYYGGGSGQNNAYTFPGVHVEGTNSPVFMLKMATFWDTGVWPDAPYDVHVLPLTGSGVGANYSGGLQSFGWVQ
jgi:hypothetical protein